jgi:Tfp pilus assembly major pilin PilA
MTTQTFGKQRGITLLGFIMVLAIAGIFAFVGFKLFPVYAEYYSAVTDLKSACKEPDAPNASLQEMRAKLDRRFNISYITSININKDVKLVRNGDVKALNINYEVRKPLIYNLDFVAKFDVTEPMTGGGKGGL